MSFEHILLNYFWGFGALIGIFNTIAFSRRVKRVTVTEPDLAKAGNRSITYILLLMVIPPLLLQLFQMLGRYANPFYIFAADGGNVFYILAIVVLAICWLAIALLILKGPLLSVLIAFEQEKGGKSGVNYPLAVKIAVIFAIAIGVTLLIVGNHFRLYQYLLSLTDSVTKAPLEQSLPFSYASSPHLQQAGSGLEASRALILRQISIFTQSVSTLGS